MDITNQDQWILYSGESQHVTKNLKIHYDKVEINDTMDMENETTLE